MKVSVLPPSWLERSLFSLGIHLQLDRWISNAARWCKSAEIRYWACVYMKRERERRGGTGKCINIFDILCFYTHSESLSLQNKLNWIYSSNKTWKHNGRWLNKIRARGNTFPTNLRDEANIQYISYFSLSRGQALLFSWLSHPLWLTVHLSRCYHFEVCSFWRALATGTFEMPQTFLDWPHLEPLSTENYTSQLQPFPTHCPLCWSASSWHCTMWPFWKYRNTEWVTRH